MFFDVLMASSSEFVPSTKLSSPEGKELWIDECVYI